MEQALTMKNQEAAAAEIDAIDDAVFSLLSTHPSPTWETVGRHIVAADNRVQSLMANLQTVCELAYDDEGAKMLEWLTEKAQEREHRYFTNPSFTAAVNGLAKARLTREQREWVNDTLTSVDHYATANLERLRELESELARETAAFNDHYQRSLESWVLRIENRSHLGGLRLELVERWEKVDEDDGPVWWEADLDEDVWMEVLDTADSRDLRRAIHYGYTTLASDLVPSLENNIDRAERILALRHEQATMLEHRTFASYTLSDMTLTDPDRIIRLLRRLDKKVDAKAKAERAEAAEHAGHDIHDWDVRYHLRKKMREEGVECDLYPYLRTDDTFDRMLDYFGPMFGLTFTEVSRNDEQRFFEVREGEKLLGGFYADLFRRHKKLDMCCVSKLTHHSEGTLPTYILILNYEEFMHHRNLVTMLHEFGHLLHGLINRSTIPHFSGYDSMKLDAVEFMSQFMENFAWHKASLRVLCRHHKDGSVPSNEMFDNLIKEKHTTSGTYLSEYLKKSLADILLHHEYESEENFVLNKVNEVIEANGLKKEEWSNRMIGRLHHSFGSIAGYESAYYIYIWSELFARDVFEPFTRRRTMNGLREEMSRFVDIFLRPTRLNFINQYKKYMGRPMKEDAWYKFYGIS
jgi:oligopeptidase A